MPTCWRSKGHYLFQLWAPVHQEESRTNNFQLSPFNPALADGRVGCVLSHPSGAVQAPGRRQKPGMEKKSRAPMVAEGAGRIGGRNATRPAPTWAFALNNPQQVSAARSPRDGRAYTTSRATGRPVVGAWERGRSWSATSPPATAKGRGHGPSGTDGRGGGRASFPLP